MKYHKPLVGLLSHGRISSINGTEFGGCRKHKGPGSRQQGDPTGPAAASAGALRDQRTEPDWTFWEVRLEKVAPSARPIQPPPPFLSWLKSSYPTRDISNQKRI
ncbi:hypothetical protein SKAU_G00257030 [Synaphobranchus kaupii]|uniref:Uncharacterized protein n=1 Tax=Synaphobranchus kaupii TaxID=118154 RepID=A0A9Q1IS64_SYNKA|nr:hypothetical protein SKAU_G00257030 [Synaphobranchus kaupii]